MCKAINHKCAVLIQSVDLRAHYLIFMLHLNCNKTLLINIKQQHLEELLKN